jgi:hypothetical protein
MSILRTPDVDEFQFRRTDQQADTRRNEALTQAGILKVSESDISAKPHQKLRLVPIEFGAKDGKDDEPNVLGPDSYDDFDKTVVKIV